MTMDKKNYSNNFNSSKIYKIEQKYLKDIKEQDKINRNIIVIFFIIFAIMFIYTANIKKEYFKLENQVKLYKIYYDSNSNLNDNCITKV